MKTSIDSLKLAVSWKGSQIPGAKFTVKVCVHSLLRWEGEIILCVIFVFVFFYVTSVPIEKGHIRFRGIGLELASSGGSCWGISLTQREKCHLHLKRLPALSVTAN